jgi:hypothetical protein
MNARPVCPCLAAALLLALAPTSRAAESKGAATLLTPETVGFLHVNVGELWDSPSLAFYRRVIAGLGAEELKAFDAKFIPGPAQIEGLTVIMASKEVRELLPDGRPTGESMLWVITTKKPLERADLVKALGPETRVKAYRGTDYFFDEAHWAGVIQLDPTTLLVALEDSIVRALDQREQARGKSGVLADVFARESGKHTALLALNPPVLATKEFQKELPADARPLLKATAAWLTLDMKKSTVLGAAVEFDTPELAAAGRKGLEGVRKMFLDVVAKGLKEMQAQEAAATKRPLMGPLDLPASFLPLVGKAGLKHVEAALKGMTVETTETTLRTALDLTEFLPASSDALVLLGFFALSERSGSYYAMARSTGPEELPYHLSDPFRRIAAALEAYHADKGSYPPAALYAKDGTPLLSWRVLILPYLEQRPGEMPGVGMRGQPFPPREDVPQVKRTYADLYKQFNLDEPWDGLNNKRLLEKMPAPYRAEFSMNSWRTRTDWRTGMQVFTGPGTLFPGREGVSKGQVRDGLEATIAVAFRDDPLGAVPWTKPADMPYGPRPQRRRRAARRATSARHPRGSCRVQHQSH